MPNLRFPMDPTSVSVGPFAGELSSFDTFIGEQERVRPSLKVTVIREVISYNIETDIQVFRAVVESSAPPVSVTNVVCKAGFGRRGSEAVKREVELYNNQLSELQGNSVPWLFGCYIGITDEGITAVMLMEDGGKPLPRALRELPVSIRQQAVGELITIHRTGIRHGNFDDDSIVISQIEEGERKGEIHPMIVGFQRAKEHDCGLEMQIKMYDPRPETVDVQCKELHRACDENDIWVPSMVNFYGYYIPIDSETTPEIILEKARIPRGVSSEDAIAMAENVLREVNEWYDDREKWDKTPVIL